MEQARHARRGVTVAVVLVTFTMALAACGSSDKSQSTTGPTPNGASSSEVLEQARTATQRALKGTNRPVDTTARPAVEGKHIVVISTGQSSISSSVPSNAAVDRGEGHRLEGRPLRRQAQPVELRAACPSGDRGRRGRHRPGRDRLPGGPAATPGGEGQGHRRRADLRLRLQRPARRKGKEALFTGFIELWREAGERHRRLHRAVRRRPGELHHRRLGQQGEDHRDPGPGVHGAVLHLPGVQEDGRQVGRLADRRHVERDDQPTSQPAGRSPRSRPNCCAIRKRPGSRFRTPTSRRSASSPPSGPTRTT